MTSHWIGVVKADDTLRCPGFSNKKTNGTFGGVNRWHDAPRKTITILQKKI